MYTCMFPNSWQWCVYVHNIYRCMCPCTYMHNLYQCMYVYLYVSVRLSMCTCTWRQITDQWSQVWFCFSQCFTFSLNVFRSVCIFISVGRAFQRCIPFTEKDDWPKVVLCCAILQLPFADPLVVILLFIFVTYGQSIAGARLFKHLKISLMKENLIKLS